MTTFNKAALRAFFEQGDIPTGQNYADLIDSQVNIVETANQVMAGALETTKLITPTVSAANFNVTGILTAQNITINDAAQFNGALFIGSDVSANNNMTLAGNLEVGNNIDAATVSASGNIKGQNITARGILTVSANIVCTSFTVQASGTSLATANVLPTASNIRGQGVSDGTATGFRLLGANSGLIQFFTNETAVSANLWPAGADYRINALASGAAFPLAASTMYTIIYRTASAYSVK